jgi:hypothetical protein
VLRALAGQLQDLVGQLSAGAATPSSGPGWQPSAAAPNEVSSTSGHVSSECGKHLTDFGGKFGAAANAYSHGDESGAAAVSGTMSHPN